MPSPNIGPENQDPVDPDAVESPRRGNPAPVLRNGQTDDVIAASARASAVSHRFGGVRYGLTRRQKRSTEQDPPTEESGGAES